MNATYYYAALILVLMLWIVFVRWIKKSWVGQQSNKALANYRFNKVAATVAICCYVFIILITLDELFFSKSPPRHPFLEISLAVFCIVCFSISLRAKRRDLILKQDGDLK